jgi:membrane protease YdiL (CAAX protease family)
MVVEGMLLYLLLGGPPEGPIEVGLATLTQFGLFFVVILLAMRVSGRDPRKALAVRRPRLAHMGLAVVGGSFVGIAPLWLSAKIIEKWPEAQPESLGVMTEVLMGDGAVWLLLLGIVVVGPIVEEFVFRGALWAFLSGVLSPLALLTLTSSLFALYHFAPLHVISVLPIAFLLGVLRYASGSIWPPIVAHIVNNLGAVLLLGAAQPSGLMAAEGLFVTVIVVWTLWRLRVAST